MNKVTTLALQGIASIISTSAHRCLDFSHKGRAGQQRNGEEGWDCLDSGPYLCHTVPCAPDCHLINLECAMEASSCPNSKGHCLSKGENFRLRASNTQDSWSQSPRASSLCFPVTNLEVSIKPKSTSTVYPISHTDLLGLMVPVLCSSIIHRYMKFSF